VAVADRSTRCRAAADLALAGAPDLGADERW
jgi:hypothetical protein